jgi:hypothetical protein
MPVLCNWAVRESDLFFYFPNIFKSLQIQKFV